MMPGFEEEAFERARRMSSRRGSPQREEQKPPPPKPEQPKPEPQKPVPAKPGPAITAPQPAPNLLNTLLGSKENSLIAMLSSAHATQAIEAIAITKTIRND